MKDDELEDLLRRVRPLGPSSRLRTRIVGAEPHAGRTWPWAAAAAAMLTMTVVLHAGATRMARTASAPPGGLDRGVGALTNMFGGDAAARAAAEAIVAIDLLRPGDGAAPRDAEAPAVPR